VSGGNRPRGPGRTRPRVHKAPGPRGPVSTLHNRVSVRAGQTCGPGTSWP